MSNVVFTELQWVIIQQTDTERLEKLTWHSFDRFVGWTAKYLLKLSEHQVFHKLMKLPYLLH